MSNSIFHPRDEDDSLLITLRSSSTKKSRWGTSQRGRGRVCADYQAGVFAFWHANFQVLKCLQLVHYPYHAELIFSPRILWIDIFPLEFVYYRISFASSCGWLFNLSMHLFQCCSWWSVLCWWSIHHMCHVSRQFFIRILGLPEKWCLWNMHKDLCNRSWRFSAQWSYPLFLFLTISLVQ